MPPKKSAKKPAKQLEREIGELLSRGQSKGNGNGGMERVTRERVHEALVGERITRREPVHVSLPVYQLSRGT